MPRLRRRGHRTLNSGPIAEKLARLTKWDFLGGEYPSGFETPAARQAFDAERQRHWQQRAALRDAVLRERLQNGDVYELVNIFCERPEWEAELSPEQRERWQAHCEEARRKILRETLSNIVPMPAVKETHERTSE